MYAVTEDTRERDSTIVRDNCLVQTKANVRPFYDRFGRLQDMQRFYEQPAIAGLLAHAGFEDAKAVCEFGCGTGWLARELLLRHLPPDAIYLGLDESPTMVAIARNRLRSLGQRARIELTDGSIRISHPDKSFDRFLCTYVFDLLASDDLRSLVNEAHRILLPGGRACIISLTFGVTRVQRIISETWNALWQFQPLLVGGCRPIQASRYFDSAHWRLLHRDVISSWGLNSEVVVVSTISSA